MKKLGLIGVAVAALLLAGCSAPVGVLDATSVPSTETPTVAPEPLAVDETPADAAKLDDKQFLEEVRLRVKTVTEATDEQLIAAGREACEQLAAGTSKTEVRVVEGEVADAESGSFNDSRVIANWAAKAYCPEFDS